jgi:hypothetical protein
MAISGQGLASGFSGGFKMMDDYYNRQETQQLNRETAERTKTVYEQGQKKIRIEDAIKGAAMDIKAGRMPSQQWVDTLQNDLGYDLYQNLDPQYQQSVDNILNQKNPIASPEFVADANIAFKDYLNKNNTQTEFTTFGREIETGMGDSFQSEAAQKLEVGSYRGKPQTIKGKRILNKELVGSMYAMGGGTIGGDVEVTYEDMDGNIKTYIAPMTDGQGTSGDGDNVVGQDVGKLLQNLKGRTMLSDGLSPLMKSLSSLMVSQGINIPINDVDKERLRSYETQATNYMTLARQNAKDMFPKASESDQMMIMMAASKNQDLSELQLADGSKPNAEAVAAYKANMAKAQGLFNKIDVIHKKYSLGDFQNSSVEAGIQSKIAEPFVPMNEKVNQLVQANNGVQTNANPNGQGIKPPKPDGTSVAPQKPELNAAVSTVASGKGINPAATRREDGLGIDPNRYPSGRVELPVLNSETGSRFVAGGANDTRRTVRDMNQIIDISESGNLGTWLGESFENQKQAQNILDTAAKDEYLSKENAADITAFSQLLADNQIPMDNPKSINYAGYVQGLQSDRQKKVDGAINYTKEAVNEAVIDRELVDMKAALNDPDMMALIRKEVSRDPNAHIDEVENLLSSIQALPKTNKTYEQYEAVYKYWSEIGGAQRMSPAAAPAGDGLFDSWVQGVKSMMGKAPPSVYDQMEGSGLMDQINIVIQLGELGKLNQYVKEKGDEAIKQIYSAALSRKAPAAVLERLESVLKNMTQQ